MALSEELDRLDDLRRRAALSDEEFARAKARLLGRNEAPTLATLSALRRSRTERWIAGVCGGIAQATVPTPGSGACFSRCRRTK